MPRRVISRLLFSSAKPMEKSRRGEGRNLLPSLPPPPRARMAESGSRHFETTVVRQNYFQRK
jgi:hypothetical protein